METSRSSIEAAYIEWRNDHADNTANEAREGYHAARQRSGWPRLNIDGSRIVKERHYEESYSLVASWDINDVDPVRATRITNGSIGLYTGLSTGADRKEILHEITARIRDRSQRPAETRG
jgi:hypothetical protein